MKLSLARFISNEDTTLGTLKIEDTLECFTVEDEFREIKVAGETRIPAGTYNIDVKTHGGFDARYRRKFNGFHRGMLHLVNVPGFTDILIHIGNTDKNTAGCILVNAGVFARSGKMSGQASKEAYRRFYSKVIDAAEAGTLSIEIKDED